MLRTIMLCSVCPIVLGVAGGRIVVSQKFPDYAVTKIVPLLADLLTQLEIPDISGQYEDWQYDVDNFKIDSVVCVNPKLTFLEGVGFFVNLENIVLKASASWRYNHRRWPYLPRGKGKVDISSGIDSHINATLKAATVNDRPQFQIQSIDVSIGSYKIKTHGNLFGWLYNILVKAVAKPIGNAINGAVKSLITSQISFLNEMIGNYSFSQDVPVPPPYDKSAIDFRITDIKAYSDYIIADDRVEWYPTDGNPRYKGTAPVVPMTSFTDRQIKVEASSYLFDSAFYTFTKENLLKYSVTPDLVPWYSPVKLSATTFAGFAPGLLNYAGHSITINATTVPRGDWDAHSIEFKDGFLMATLPGSFDFFVMDSDISGPAFTIKCPILVAATLDVAGTGSDQSVVFNLKNASCKPLDVVHSVVGRVRAKGWFSIEQALKLVISQIILPSANEALSAGIPLPTFAGVSLVNTATVVEEGKLQVQSDVQFDFDRDTAPVFKWPNEWADGSWRVQEKRQSEMFV